MSDNDPTPPDTGSWHGFARSTPPTDVIRTAYRSNPPMPPDVTRSWLPFLDPLLEGGDVLTCNEPGVIILRKADGTEFTFREDEIHCNCAGCRQTSSPPTPVRATGLGWARHRHMPLGFRTL